MGKSNGDIAGAILVVGALITTAYATVNDINSFGLGVAVFAVSLVGFVKLFFE
jgi:hypothetical protein